MWQARAVAASLEQRGVAAELVSISTHGDRRQDVPLTAIGGKGVFVREIHEALLRGDIDLAVHSAKDMAAISPEGLTIAATLPREDPRDALVVGRDFSPGDPAAHQGHPFELDAAARQGASYARGVIGTGSPRRIAQLRRLFPHARFEPIRGNVDTRLRKLDAGSVDALVLACAGLRRLGLAERITAPIGVDDCVPAPGQGIIAVEARRSDGRTLEILGAIDDPASRMALSAEQAVVAELGGGCQLPLGVYAEAHEGILSIRAIAASSEGDSVVEGQVTGDPNDPAEAGTRLARELASRGARELLNS